MLQEVRVLSRTVTGGFGEGEPGARRRFVRAGLAGGALATVVFLLVLLNGGTDLFQGGDRLRWFYDLQAHSLLRGHWDVPGRPLSIEGFRIGSRTYMYFGPFPAILRMPIAAFTDRFDGRLTQISLLLAFVVAMGATVSLLWRVRPLLRKDERLTTAECWAVGVFVFVTGAGTVLLFLGTQLIVYHEAELWAIALAIAALNRVIAATQSPTNRNVALACLLTTFVMMTRGVVGGGPVVALGLLALASFAPATRRFVGLPDDAPGASLAARFAIAAAVPVLLYMYVNYAKFGTLLTLPFERQVATLANASHRAVLNANGGSLVGEQFVPTTLLQYFRPDAIRFDVLAPWATFPDPATVVGDVRFDQIGPTSSVIDSMLLSTVLAVVGLVALLRRRTAAALAVMRVPVIGAAVASLGVLTFGFIVQRYIGDFVPVVVLLAAIGLFQAVTWATRPQSTKVVRRALWAMGCVLVAVSVWWSAGLAIYFQNAIATYNDSEVADFVRWQYDIHDVFPGGDPPHVERRDAIPAPMTVGTVLVLGDCLGLYWSDGTLWRSFERTPATGLFHFAVTFPPGVPARTRQTLLATGSPDDGQQVSILYRGNDRAILEYVSKPGAFHVTSRPFAVKPGRRRTMTISLDRYRGQALVAVDGVGLIAAGVFSSSGLIRRLEAVNVGGASEIGGPAAPFSGTISEKPAHTPFCRQLTS